MKNMKSVLVLLLCLCLTMACMVGCGNTTTTTTTSTNPTPEVPTVTDSPVTDEAEPAGDANVKDFGYTADDPLVLKLGHMGNESSTSYALSSLYEQMVEEATDGAVDIVLYPSGQLGKDAAVFESVTQGIVDMAINNTPNITGYVPALEILDLGYLFDDYDAVLNFLDSEVAQKLMDEVKPTGATMLALNSFGFRNFANSKRTVKVPDDLKGLIIRVTESNYYQKSIAAFGASPVSMSGNELITALQQGTVDGSDQHTINLWADGIYEFCKNVSLTEHVVHFNGITINTALYEGLTPDLQEVLSSCAVEACLIRSEAMEDEQAAKQAELEEMGLVFTEVDKELWKSCLTDVYEDFRANHPAAYLLDDILACNE
ncbi:MAG: TRAP transporter substrate-binding protein [Oscillospiraceae bacterium]|nr:TRAP transporter substrate-binding protein [Oscillospiraceae bacterium]